MLPFGLELPVGAPLRLLCLGAHADDIEIGAGGLVLDLLAAERPVEVHWVVFSANEERQAEARASAAEFLRGAARASVDIQTFRESYFPYVAAEIKEHFGAVRSAFSPHLVLSHRREDLHQDHRLLAELTWNTFRDHPILEYEIPKYEGDLGHPNLFLPLAPALVERKIALIDEHFASQRAKPWFDAETFRATLRLRGLECNSPTRYAEAFHARKMMLQSAALTPAKRA